MRLMKRVARTVALKLSEAKRFTSLGFDANPATDYGAPRRFRWTYKNVFSGIPSAAGGSAGASFSLVGNEMVDPLAKAKFSFSWNYADILAARNYDAYGTVMGWVYIVATTDQLETTGFTQYPAQGSSTDPGWFMNQDPYRPTLNGNNCKIVRRWRIQHQPVNLAPTALTSTGQTIITTSFSGAGTIIKNLTCKHRWKGKKTFEDFTQTANPGNANYFRSTFLRGWNYYWLVGWTVPEVVPFAQAPAIINDQYLYFKDP